MWGMVMVNNNFAQ